MKSLLRNLTLPPVVVMVAALSAPLQAHARCDREALPHEQRACAAARLGIDELRRFVERTRKLYQLDISDFAAALAAGKLAKARPESDATVAPKESEPV